MRKKEREKKEMENTGNCPFENIGFYLGIAATKFEKTLDKLKLCVKIVITMKQYASRPHLLSSVLKG